jgi:hypothetical protein
MLIPDDASVLPFVVVALLILTISHMPTPIPVIIKAITMRIVLILTVIRPFSGLFSVSRI